MKIDTPGTYTLTANITNTSVTDACIEITTDSVTLDGNGHWMQASITRSPTAVDVTTASNVVVTDLTVKEFGTAVTFSGVTDGRIENVSTGSGSTQTGQAIDSNGIVLYGGSGNTIRNNALYEVGESGSAGSSGNAILLVDSHDNRIEHNELVSPAYAGVRLWHANGNELIANTIEGDPYRGAARYGIQIGGVGDHPSNHTYVANNDVYGRSQFFGNDPGMVEGIAVNGGTGNTLSGNLVQKTYAEGISVGDEATTVVDNAVLESGEEGIVVYDPLANLTDNTVRTSGKDVASDGILVQGDDAIVVGNTITASAEDGLHFDGVSNLTVRNNSVDYNTGWGVELTSMAVSETIRNTDLGTSAESVTASGTDFALSGGSSGPTLPAGERDVGIFVETNLTSGGGHVRLAVHYADSQVAGVDESTLSMFRHGGSWSELSGTNYVDAANNTVVGETTADGLLAPLAANQPPVASLTASETTLAPGETVTFDASGSSDPDGQIAEYRWDFDGDGVVDRKTYSSTTTHSYPANGTYNANLTVVDGGDDTDTDALSMTVESRPVANLSVSPNPTSTNASTTFDGSRSVYDDGSIVEYRWDVDGDGVVDTTTASATTNYTYPTNGSYAPTLTVVGGDGTTDAASAAVTVTDNLPPVAGGLSYTLPRGWGTNSQVGDTIGFTAQNFDDHDGVLVEYRWDFDGDDTIDQVTSSRTVYHAFEEPGTYTTKVVVMDDDGATANATATQTIDPKQTGTLSGVVTNASSGAPVANVTVDALESPSGSFVDWTATNGTGVYDLELQTGDYNVTVDPVGYAPDHQVITISENTTTTADFQLQPVSNDPVPGTGTLYGYVNDTSDVGIGSATVTAVNQSGDVATTTTWSDGYYSFDVPAGSYDLVVEKSGYQTARRPISVGENLWMYNEFELEPTNVPVTIDSTNTPVVEGDTLSVNATVENTGSSQVTQTVTLSVDATQRDSTAVTLAPGANQTVTLSWATTTGDAGSYVATVASPTDSDSASVSVAADAPDFPVTVDSTNAPVVEGDTLSVDATVENDGATQSTETVSLTVGGVQRDSVSVTLAPGENRTVTLNWATASGDAGSYTATVASSDDSDSVAVSVNAPAAQFPVSITALDTPVTETETLNVTAAIENTGGASATSTVTLSVDGTQTDSKSVALAGGETRTVTLSWATADGDAGEHGLTVASSDDSASTAVTIYEGGFVEGTVTNTTAGPIPGAAVAIIDSASGQRLANVSADGSGSFGPVRLPAGTYRVGAFASGYEPSLTSLTLGVDETKNVPLTLSPINQFVEGTVTNASGTPIQGATVTIVDRQTGTRWNTTSTDGTGAFGPVGVLAGNYSVEVTKSGYEPDTTNVSVADAETKDVSAVLSPPNQYITGRVTNVSGTPIQGATVTIVDRQAGVTVNTATTDATGDFGPVGLPEGNYSVRVTKSGYDPAVQNVSLSDAETEDVPLVLAPPNQYIKGTVTNTSAAPVQGATVTIVDRNTGSTADTATTDATGDFGPVAVLAGDYRIEVTKVGYDSDVRNVTVSDAETEDVPVVLVENASNVDPSPTANFTFSPAPNYVGEPIVFNASIATDPTNDIVTYEWDMEADGTYELNYSDPTHVLTYVNVGTKTVRLRVTDDDGNTDVFEQNVTILPGEPTANFTHSPSPNYVGEPIVFNASSTIDPTDDIVTYDWDMEADGTYELSYASPTHVLTYVNAGVKTVRLRVTDDDGNTDVFERNVTVQPGGPTANFTHSPSPNYVGEPIVFNASTTTDPTDDVVTYDWDMEDDGTYELSYAGPTHVLSYVNPGTKTVRLRVTDDDGNTDTFTRQVTIVDRTPPTVELAAIDANASATTPATGGTVRANTTLGLNVTADDGFGSVAAVRVVLRSDFSNFRAFFDATRANGQNWTSTIDLSNTSALPDDGVYDLGLLAVDVAGNVNVTGTNETIVLDREEPELAATISQVDADTGRVNVTASEQLASAPTISVALPNGTTETPSLATQGSSRWNATFDLTGTSGQYNVTVTGTDLAGNQGTDTATAKIGTVSTPDNGTTTVVLEPSGTFVNLTTANATSDTVVLTTSDSALAPLTAGQTGVGFLDGRLGDALDANLSHAVVGVPIPQQLPGNVDPATVNVTYYNASKSGPNKWEALNTTVDVRTINGTTRTYWIATVPHFSTYGAVASDTAAPSLVDATPTGTLSVGTKNQTVRFEYADDLSGVNASAVTLAFDGTDVTDDAATSITSQYATYHATGLASGTHTATVTVADAAGNPASYTRSFTIAKATSSGTSGGTGGGGGGGSVPPPSLLTEITPLPDGGVQATIQNGRAGRTARLAFDDVATGDVTVDRLDLTFASEQSTVTLTVAPSDGAPTGTPALEGADPLGYLSIDHDAPVAVEDATIHFDVDRSALPDGTTLDDVVLYRYHDGEWAALDTSHRATAFEATTPGFSTFAVGVVREPSLSVGDLTLSTTTVAPGQSVDVSATVTNDGAVAGETTVALSVDGETVATRSVAASPGDAATVTFSHTFEDPGTYEVAIGEHVVGSVQVAAVDESTTVGHPGATSATSDGQPGFGFAAALGGLVVLLFARRRRR